MGRTRITLDCRALCDPDLGTLDVLLRLSLEMKRAGADLVLVDPTPQLRALISLCGIEDLVELGPLSRVAEEARRAGRGAPYRGRK
jgi:anti-anti-sigma regulatory factor